MPYNPTVNQNLPALMAQQMWSNVNRSFAELGEKLEKAAAERKTRAQVANKTRSLLATLDPDNKDDYATMGLEQLLGRAQGIAMKQEMLKDQTASAYQAALMEQLMANRTEQDRQRQRLAAYNLDLERLVGPQAVEAQGPALPGQARPTAMVPAPEVRINDLLMLQARHGLADPASVLAARKQEGQLDIAQLLGGQGGGGGLGGDWTVGGVTVDSTGRATASMLPRLPAAVVPQNLVPTGGTVDPVSGKTSISYGQVPAPTVEQSAAMQFSDRMRSMNGITSDLERQGFDPSAVATGVQTWLPNLLRGENVQRYEAAKANWIEAALRKESGAAIGAAERANAARQYFPVMGDSAAVVAQKAALRQLAEDNMRKAAGQFAPGATGPSAAPASAAPTQPAGTAPTAPAAPAPAYVPGMFYQDKTGQKFMYRPVNPYDPKDTQNFIPVPTR